MPTLPTPNRDAAWGASHAEASDWALSLAQSSAQRGCHRRSRLFAGALLASAILPLGIWTPTETPVGADEAPAASTSTSTSAAATDPRAAKPSPIAAPSAASSVVNALPAAPAAGSSAASASAPTTTGMARWQVRAVVGGFEMERGLDVPRGGATVGEVLKMMGFTLGPLDRVSPLASERAYSGISIRVRRVAAPLKKRIESVPFETRYLPTSTLRPGQAGVVQHGRTGQVEVTERVWSVDERVTLREQVSRKKVRTAQDQVVGLGSRGAYVPSRVPYHRRYAQAYGLSSRSGSPRDRYAAAATTVPGLPGRSLRAVKMVELVATGYSPDPRENGGYTTTATGLPIGYGAAATDPRVIPLGTKLYVEGYGYAFACDTGGAIKGKRIDLAYNSYYEANTKGRKRVRVWILAD